MKFSPRLFAALAVSSGALTSSATAQQTAPIEAPPGMKLVWNDEFDKVGPVDLNKWTPELGFVRNKDVAFQVYQPSNARVEGGLLIIEGRKERVANPFYKEGSDDWRFNRPFADYTSASFNTRGKGAWRYGRFEIRCKIDPRTSSWPAFWTIGEKGPWPHGGELDIMEFYDHSMVANIWWGGAKPGVDKRHAKVEPLKNFGADWANEFHTWTMDWDENKIAISIDGKPFHTHDVNLSTNADGSGRNPLREPQIIILNQAIGQGDPAEVTFPMRFEVDYVRVFQKK
jgi:beta-glucanase (GH16 family)